jgi:hypothetical protein
MQAKQYSFTIAPAALAPLPCVSWRRCNAVGCAATDAGGQSQVSAAKQCAASLHVSYRLVDNSTDVSVNIRIMIHVTVDQIPVDTVCSLLKGAQSKCPTCSST